MVMCNVGPVTTTCGANKPQDRWQLWYSCTPYNAIFYLFFPKLVIFKKLMLCCPCITIKFQNE